MTTAGKVLSFRGLELELLEGLAEQQQQIVLRSARLRRAAVGEVLCRAGNTATGVYTLLAGRAKLYVETEEGTNILLRWVVPGETLGVAAVAETQSRVYSATAQADRETDLLEWEAATLRALAKIHPKLLLNVISILLNRWNEALKRIEMLATQDKEDRLASILTDLADHLGIATIDGVEINISHQELAAMAGTTVFSISRVLSSWEREGILHKRRGAVVLHRGEGRFFLSDS